MTDFNDLASQNPEILTAQFQQLLARPTRQGKEGEMSTNMERAVLRTMLSDSPRGTKERGLYAPRHAIRGNHIPSVELDRDL